MGIIKDAFLAGLGFVRKPEPVGDLPDYVRSVTPPNSPLMEAMRNVDADEEQRKITVAQSGENQPWIILGQTGIGALDKNKLALIQSSREDFAAGNRNSFLSTDGTIRTPPEGSRARAQDEMGIALDILSAHKAKGGFPLDPKCRDAVEIIVRLDAGFWGQPFGKRLTPPPAAPRMPIEDMVSVMVPKRDSGLLADIIRIRMRGGSPQVFDAMKMSPSTRAIAYALACENANGSGAAIEWLRTWNLGDPEAQKEMEAYENDGN